MHTKNLSAYFQTGIPLNTEVMNLVSLNEIVSTQLLVTWFRGGVFWLAGLFAHVGTTNQIVS